MNRTLHLLLVEDCEDDALLLIRQIQHCGYKVEYNRVDTERSLGAALDEREWDAILADFKLPQFGALEALELVQKRGADLPFILVSGAVGEELAVAAMKAGAHDYVTKSNLARLVPAIEREMREARIRQERRSAEEKLAYQARLLSNINDAVIATDENSILTAWNQSAEQLYGWMEKEALGRRIEEIIPTGLTRDEWALVQAKLENRGRHAWEAVHYRKDGRPVHLEGTTMALYSEHGGVSGFVHICHDVTARVEAEEVLLRSEERFFKVFRSSPAAIAIVASDDDRLIELNDCFADFFGFPREELIGRNTAELHLWADHADQERIMDSVRLEGALREVETKFRTRSGEIRTVLLSIETIPLPQPVRIEMFLDITERKHVEADLRQTTERLQALSHRLLEVQEQERRHLARELHDQIGQALTAVKINLQAIQRFPDPAALAARIDDSVRILDRLLNQVRNLSLDLRPPLLDDLGLLAALRWYLNQQASRAGWKAHFKADLPNARVEPALETACFRIAQEAITNIIRHAQAKNVTVELRREGSMLHLAVVDDGNGFDVAMAEARATHRTSLGWLGMQERAALVGGHLFCRSTKQMGTEVHAYFPLTHSLLESESSASGLPS